MFPFFIPILSYLFIKMFIYFECTLERAGGRDKGRGSERILSRLCAGSTEPDAGLDPMNRETMT